MPAREPKPQSLESSTRKGRILEIAGYAVAVWVVPEAECQQVTRDVSVYLPRRSANRRGQIATTETSTWKGGQSGL